MRNIIVSNRMPLNADFKNSKLSITSSVGGLATGLSSIHPNKESLWIGWMGLEEEEIPCDERKDELMEITVSHHCIPVLLTREDVEDYYYGASNRIIWPLFHYFTQYAKYSAKKWEGYRRVNEKFAEAVLEHAEPKSLIWVHDYHLMLLPRLIRNKRSTDKIGFFLHIPFPSFEVFRTLPCREEILEGLLGADIIGFHTFDYQQHFLDCVSRLLPAAVNCNQVTYRGHTSTVEVYPMGIDAQRFEKEARAQQDPESTKTLPLKEELQKYSHINPDIKYILSIDRLDYTKGIANRIKAFDYFLEHNPWAIGKVRLLMVAVPSRTSVPQYQDLKKEIDELVGRVNSKYATLEWSPIWYFYRSFSFESLVELYSTCHVAFITPIRDGMNLVAKEYVMARPQKNGVLILSEMAGAAKELPEALLINPTSFKDINDALVQALKMEETEQIERMETMQDRIRKFDVSRWANSFIKDLKSVTASQSKMQPYILSEKKLVPLLKKYSKSKRRLILLDYDGTLTGFRKNPEDAVPDKELYKLLSRLSGTETNDVYIVSGRDHTILGEWFKDLRVNLIAEHGFYKKRCFQNWNATPGLSTTWKERIKPLLEKFVAQVPGSFIEEKTFSLAWHYRKASVEFGDTRAAEMLKILKSWSTNLNIQVLDGNKVIEVTTGNINKGSAVQKMVCSGVYDFILAIGDDHTDEFLFQQLPENAISIKVGSGPSCAEFRLKDFKETRELLFKLFEENNKVPNSQWTLAHEESEG